MTDLTGDNRENREGNSLLEESPESIPISVHSRSFAVEIPVSVASVTSCKILQGGALDVLKSLPEQSVHCCVTSPPYWGLRDYGVEGQLGLERDPDDYVRKVVEIFAQVWRVLRDDGTLWLNIGDSYHQGPKGNSGPMCDGYKQRTNVGSLQTRRGDSLSPTRTQHLPGLKPKDLIGMPWRVAFALQKFGWYLRTEIVCHKKNPMPESVRDRPTRAHEYVFLLSKSARYYYDCEAIKEPASASSHLRISQATLQQQRGGSKTEQYQMNFPGRKQRDRKPVIIQAMALKNGVHPKARANGPNSRMVTERTPNGNAHKPNPSRSNIRPKANESFSAAVTDLVMMRNKRTVWSIATAPYKGAHFATFPPKLITPCILAGCPAGGVVLDPFAGSGTTGQVALAHGRRAVLIELKSEYCDLIKQRLKDITGDNRLFPSLPSVKTPVQISEIRVSVSSVASCKIPPP